jgi:hypothetical protein
LRPHVASDAHNMSSARTQQQRPHDRLPARTRAITHAYAHHAHGLVPHAAGSTTGKALTSGASRAVRPGSVREAVRARPAGCTRARPQKSSSSRKEPNEAKNSIPSCHAADMPVRVVEKQCTCDQGWDCVVLYRIRNNFWQWQIIIPGVNCHGN